MKVFIAQRMRGLSNQEIIDMRNKIIAKYRITDVADNLFMEDEYKVLSPVELLGKSIQKLGESDIMFAPILDYPSEYPGVETEIEIAKRYSIPIVFYVEDNL